MMNPLEPDDEHRLVKASEERLRLILNSALDAIVTIDSQGKVIDWNKRAEELFGWTGAEALGRPMTDLFIPPRFREAHARGMARFLSTGEGPILNKRVELPAMRRDGTEFPVELTVAPGKSGQEWIFTAFLRDITAAKAAENRLNLQYALTRILSESDELEQAAPQLMSAIFANTRWEVGGLWCPTEDGRSLRCLHMSHSGAWPELEAFLEQSRARHFRRGEGLPGRVWEKPVHIWIPDLDKDANFPRMDAAVAAGLNTALAYPILTGEHAHGVLELFSRQKFELDEGKLKVLVSTGSQLGQFMERRRAEKALARREQELTDFIENATVGMHWVGPDGIIQWANQCELNLLGYSREEYVGHHIAEFHADGPIINDILHRLASKEELENYEARLRCKDGTIRHVLINSNVFWDKDRFVHTRCFTRDVTERRRSEEALAESEARFRSMADSAPVFIWVAGTDALCNYFNKPWLDFRGRTLQQESGQGWAEGIHPEDFKRTLDTYLAAFNVRKPFRMEYRLRRHDGAYRWLLDTGTPRFAPDGTFSGFIGSCLDVTDLKETEEQLRQSQKMEAVGRLAGGIAHDFNNLLTAINGYTELSLAQARGDETLLEFLKEIKRSGDRASALTSQLLAYSRKQILSPRILNLNSTVAEMDRMLKRLIGEDIELVTMLEPELGWVLADPGQIQQIILNLALNARDAMPQGGRLTLETANVILDSNYISTRLEAKPGPHIMLAVSDTGSGMTEEIKAKIFEPFFTTKEVGKGTGLGLSSVYGIIQQSGGSILVYSEPGHGTTFKIYLPMVEGAQEGQPKPEALDNRTLAGKETILVVEDEETVRTFIRRALTYFGYSILEARDGKEALQAIASGRPVDLILTDVVMPGLNGRQLATEISSRLPGAPILFMSGYTDNAIVHHGVLDADATFIQKPFSQSDLLKKIREIFDSRGAKKDTSKFRVPRPSSS